MTTRKQAERDTLIADLRKIIKPGDTVYTILDHVSSSGMSRAIRVCVPVVSRAKGHKNVIEHLHPNYAVGKLLGLRHWKRQGREQDALVMGGCGMDMGFALVYELSYALYGSGYRCLGKGKCPSNYHSNHHATVHCPGVGDAFCYYGGATRMVDIGEGKTIECDTHGRDGVVCVTCDGAGRIPNPDGPPRYNLMHTDGYALRHRWL